MSSEFDDLLPSKEPADAGTLEFGPPDIARINTHSPEELLAVIALCCSELAALDELVGSEFPVSYKFFGVDATSDFLGPNERREGPIPIVQDTIELQDPTELATAIQWNTANLRVGILQDPEEMAALITGNPSAYQPLVDVINKAREANATIAGFFRAPGARVFTAALDVGKNIGRSAAD